MEGELDRLRWNCLPKSGDFVRLLPGSKHSSHTPDGCTLLVMLRGNNRALTDEELKD